MRVHQLIGPKNPPTRFLVASNLGNVGTEVTFGLAIDLDYLEGRSNATGPQTRDDAIALASERNDLILRPEPGGWRRWFGYRLARYFGQ